MAAGDEGDRPSVVLVVVDALRADRVGAYGGGHSATPELDAWTNRGVVFDHAVATSPWTLPSFGSLYSGLYPTRHGARAVSAGESERSFRGVSPDVVVVAELFRSQGYATAAIATNRFLTPAFGLARGFDVYDHAFTRDSATRRVDVAVNKALAWIDSVASSPFFLSLHVLDPHMPYDPHPSVRGRRTSAYRGKLELPVQGMVALRKRRALDEADRAFIAAAYDEEVCHVDIHLARLMTELEKRGLLQRTIVVLTADHGEEFWEHGGFEHGHTLYQELLHVPLVAWGPDLGPGRIETPVSLVDVMPTLLHAASIPAPAGLDGVSLWPALVGQGAVPERVLVSQATLYLPEGRSVIDWPWKLIEFFGSGRRELYDLQRDPGEKQNLVEAESDRAARLAEVAARWDAPPTEAATPAVKLDEQTIEELRALGYVD